MSRYAIKALAVAAALMVAPLAVFADSSGRLSAQEPAGRENGKGSKEKDLPLEPGRKLAFPASEGTWMSLDVSPDGSTLVFDLLGDLYTLPIDGGQATRLTSGMAHDVQPRFSPDIRSLCHMSAQWPF